MAGRPVHFEKLARTGGAAFFLKVHKGGLPKGFREAAVAVRSRRTLATVARHSQLRRVSATHSIQAHRHQTA